MTNARIFDPREIELRATFSDTERRILTPAEKSYLDGHEAREINRLMRSNRNRFL